jgi:hypothetical protein
VRDLRAAKIYCHRRNIERYSRLLATDITELEREYLHKRIAEERTELERWNMQPVKPVQHQSEDAPAVVVARPAPNIRDGESHA